MTEYLMPDGGITDQDMLAMLDSFETPKIQWENVTEEDLIAAITEYSKRTASNSHKN